jgi:arsenite methyltransferase
MQEQQQQIKEKIKERYGKIALTGNSDCQCCATSGVQQHTQEENANKNDSCCSSPIDSPTIIGYDAKELQSIPKASILGVGCGAPVNFANIREGEVVVDIGSGAGIDVFLSANKVKGSGKVIGIDMTEEMLEKSTKAAKENGYTNVEFRKGDVERGIPIEDDAADVVISNCVINLTIDKVAAFREIYRILRNNGRGRMVISDLVTDKKKVQTAADSIDPEKWSSCIDGALTKEKYIESIRKAGFQNVEILEEKSYTDERGGVEDKIEDGCIRMTSLVIRAVKD